MVKLRANYVDEPHVTTPANPDAGYTRTYRKADGLKYKLNDAGVEATDGGGSIGGSVGVLDMAVPRADGTGGSTLQSSGIFIGDADELYGIRILALEDITGTSTISSGAITAARGIIRVDTEAAAATDDLDTINFSGSIGCRMLFIRPSDSARTIVIRHNGGGTGNIRTFDGNSITLDDTYKYAFLLWDTLTSLWNAIGGSGGASLPIDLTTDVTGVLPIANGGTNGGTAQAGFDNLSPLTTKGDIPAHDGTNNVRLAAGADGTGIRARAGATNGIEYVGSLFAIVPATQLGSSQTTITLSSIPNYYQDLLLVIRTRSTNVAGGGIRITFNGDTGTNYGQNGTRVSSAGAETHDVQVNQAYFEIVNGAALSTSTAGYFGSALIDITGYAETAYTRLAHYLAGRSTDAASIARNEGLMVWENVANAISSIELNLSAGDFDTGTIYALYGRGTVS
jgi:hypothetical protein